MNRCFFCGKPFKENEYIYEIKFDDGKIVLSHGYPCCDKADVKRVPVNLPDWWIRKPWENWKEAKP